MARSNKGIQLPRVVEQVACTLRFVLSLTRTKSLRCEVLFFYLDLTSQRSRRYCYAGRRLQGDGRDLRLSRVIASTERERHRRMAGDARETWDDAM